MYDNHFNDISEACLKISEELDLHPPKEIRVRKRNSRIENDINFTSYAPVVKATPYEHWRTHFFEFLDVLTDKMKHTFDKNNL